jgi:predicted RNA-binding Zn ribbon-like protein
VSDLPFGSRFLFVGQYACLDFVNTRLREDGRTVDLLDGFPGLAGWLAEAGLVGAEEAQQAVKRWGGTPEGDRVVAKAKAFRETLKSMVGCIVEGETVERSSIDEINGLLRDRGGYPELIRRADGGFERRFRREFAQATQLLVPIAESASDLLTEGDPSLVKKCGNPECVLFFYDTTKNHRRRWCSMATCGNRMKARAHYERRVQRSEGGTRDDR